MKARPILFSAPMVRALLEGMKSQTRRIIKPQPDEDGICLDLSIEKYVDTSGHEYRNHYGQPGDLLWVRETCRAEELANGLAGVWYSADEGFIEIQNSEQAANRWLKLLYYRGGRGHIVPSIHMPRWASRLTLRLTSVRVERLQDISNDDARSEGLETDEFLDHDDWQYSVAPAGIPCTFRTLRSDFSALWDSINDKRGHGWETNPWVWCLMFDVITKNVDQVIRDLA